MAKVLVVDDSAIMRKNLRKLFDELGHTVVGEATNGSNAVTQYIKCKPELVTMDITMPIVNGIDCIKKIIEIDNNAKIIVVSAVNQTKLVYDAIKNGAKHYLIKPITKENLSKVLEKVIN